MEWAIEALSRSKNQHNNWKQDKKQALSEKIDKKQKLMRHDPCKSTSKTNKSKSLLFTFFTGSNKKLKLINEWTLKLWAIFLFQQSLLHMSKNSAQKNLLACHVQLWGWDFLRNRLHQKGGTSRSLIKP